MTFAEIKKNTLQPPKGRIGLWGMDISLRVGLKKRIKQQMKLSELKWGEKGKADWIDRLVTDKFGDIRFFFCSCS